LEAIEIPRDNRTTITKAQYCASISLINDILMNINVATTHAGTNNC